MSLFAEFNRPSETILLDLHQRGILTFVGSIFQYYQFTTFAMSLNELTPEMEKVVCSTDSRLRPDIRKLENGDQDGAAAEKTRLEEKQRETRKGRKHKKGEEWTPR